MNGFIVSETDIHVVEYFFTYFSKASAVRLEGGGYDSVDMFEPKIAI
jgi:hypothetical protein